MSRYSWRNLAQFDSWSTAPNGGHVLESRSAHIWHCVRCGKTAEGIHRPQFYTAPCPGSPGETGANTQGCSPSRPHDVRGAMNSKSPASGAA